MAAKKKAKRGRPVGWRAEDAKRGSLTLRMDDETLAALTKLAAAEGLSVAAYARAILERSVARKS